MRRLLPLVLGLTALSSVFVAQSGAADKPGPSCAGIAANDAKGDSVTHPIAVNAVTAQGSDNTDITRFWFDRSGGKTTANIEVKKLTKAIISDAPAKPSAVSWYVEWTLDDAVHFVNATSDGNTLTYGYGDLTANQYSEAGSTAGSFFEGDSGVVSIVIPSAIGGSVGKKLLDPAATTFENTDTGAGLSLLGTADAAPDTGGGKGWTVADCGEAAPGTTETPGGGGGTGEVVQVGKLNVKATTALGSARKAKKDKTVKVSLSGKATSIEATLHKGAFAKPKVYGKGTVATLDGKTKLKLKISKKVKKGKYTLTLVGTNPDGARATKSFGVKFKR
jgi:hypothetical protein